MPEGLLFRFSVVGALKGLIINEKSVDIEAYAHIHYDGGAFFCGLRFRFNSRPCGRRQGWGTCLVYSAYDGYLYRVGNLFHYHSQEDKKAVFRFL